MMAQKITIEIVTKLVLLVDNDVPISISDANNYMEDMFYVYEPASYHKDEDGLTVDEEHTEITTWNVQSIETV